MSLHTDHIIKAERGPWIQAENEDPGGEKDFKQEKGKGPRKVVSVGYVLIDCHIVD